MTRKQTILLHLLFWGIVLISPLGIHFSFTNDHEILQNNPEKLAERATFDIIIVIANLLIPAAFYLAYSFSSKLSNHRKTLLFLFILITILGVPAYFVNRWFFVGYVSIFGRIIPWMALGILFRLFIDRIKKEKEISMLREENLKSELALLRNQINPHLLFNSLHNIDALIHTNPEKASQSLINLSDILRQVLYENESTSLSEEICLIHKYVELQNLRNSNKKLVSMDTDNVVTDPVIAPMLFIPFVENAFKHTTNKQAERGIHIDFSTNESFIYFGVSNLFDENGTVVKDSSSGIGLANVKRRLELLYPGKYELNISTTPPYYIVKLKIEVI